MRAPGREELTESRRRDTGRSGVGEDSRKRSSGSGFDSPLRGEETPQRGRPRGPERETSRGLGTTGVTGTGPQRSWDSGCKEETLRS